MSRRDVSVCDRQESQHAFGIRSGDEFITLSNFTLEYVCEVREGVDSGFIVDVTLSNGRNLGCVLHLCNLAAVFGGSL